MYLAVFVYIVVVCFVENKLLLLLLLLHNFDQPIMTATSVLTQNIQEKEHYILSGL